jgi:hypothetical protein
MVAIRYVVRITKFEEGSSLKALVEKYLNHRAFGVCE